MKRICRKLIISNELEDYMGTIISLQIIIFGVNKYYSMNWKYLLIFILIILVFLMFFPNPYSSLNPKIKIKDTLPHHVPQIINITPVHLKSYQSVHDKIPQMIYRKFQTLSFHPQTAQ